MKKSLFLFLFSVFILFGFSASANAATYYVATTGNDSNPGTLAFPFLTIQKAADIVNPGDTVLVGDGTYTDTDGNGTVVYVRRGGTSGGYITFKSINKWGAVVDGLRTANNGWVLSSSGYRGEKDSFSILARNFRF